MSHFSSSSLPHDLTVASQFTRPGSAPDNKILLSMPTQTLESGAGRGGNVVRLNMRKKASPTEAAPEEEVSKLPSLTGVRIWPTIPYKPPRLYGYSDEGVGDPVAIRKIGWNTNFEG